MEDALVVVFPIVTNLPNEMESVIPMMVEAECARLKDAKKSVANIFFSLALKAFNLK